jgi:hypothetical protein
MTIDHAIPIEVDGSYGIIRSETGPDLIAGRPEPYRFERLLLVLGAATAIAETEFGPGARKDMYDSIISMSDAKGDFSVNWKDQAHLDRYAQSVNSALLLWGEDDIEHMSGVRRRLNEEPPEIDFGAAAVPA